MATSAAGSRIGVIVGLRAEARCLQACDVIVAAAGARAERARAQALRLTAEGVCGLVSFGLAGGLAPSLGAGDLVLAQAVVLPGGARLATDASWRGRLASVLQAAGERWAGGAVAGSDRLVADPAAKAALHAASGACATDMESHAVAEAAGAAGLPFLVVRAIADPHERAIPQAALDALGAEGELRPAAVLLALLRRPRVLPALVRLGRDSGRGFRTLRRVAALGVPDLAFR